MFFKDLKVEIVKNEKAEKLYAKYAYAKIGERKWYMPHNYIVNGDKTYSFETRPDDIWIITFPRSGTTLTQEIVWLLENGLNFDKARQKSLKDRFPFLDCGVILQDGYCQNSEMDRWSTKSVEFVQQQPSPRFIKSHLPFELLPTVVNSDNRIIYIARNPKDVVVSWYYFQKNIDVIEFRGTFEEFCDLFINDCTLYSPYWEHIKTAWAKRDRPNTLFLFYEDLRKDLPGSIKKIAAFLGKSYSDEQIIKLTEHLDIKKFRENPMVNQPSGSKSLKPEMFIRQGKVGGWKEMFTPEIEEKFNKWIVDNLKDTDLVFPS